MTNIEIQERLHALNNKLKEDYKALNRVWKIEVGNINPNRRHKKGCKSWN